MAFLLERAQLRSHQARYGENSPHRDHRQQQWRIGRSIKISGAARDRAALPIREEDDELGLTTWRSQTHYRKRLPKQGMGGIRDGDGA